MLYGLALGLVNSVRFRIMKQKACPTVCLRLACGIIARAVSPAITSTDHGQNQNIQFHQSQITTNFDDKGKKLFTCNYKYQKYFFTDLNLDP